VVLCLNGGERVLPENPKEGASVLAENHSISLLEISALVRGGEVHPEMPLFSNMGCSAGMRGMLDCVELSFRNLK